MCSQNYSVINSVISVIRLINKSMSGIPVLKQAHQGIPKSIMARRSCQPRKIIITVSISKT
jgi:hypothetical protein